MNDLLNIIHHTLGARGVPLDAYLAGTTYEPMHVRDEIRIVDTAEGISIRVLMPLSDTPENASSKIAAELAANRFANAWLVGA